MKPWDWRMAWAGCVPSSDRRDGVRYFHAHDVNDNAACEPHLGLMASCEEPNEGSTFCPDCIDVVRQEPAGRPLREHAASGARDAGPPAGDTPGAH